MPSSPISPCPSCPPPAAGGHGCAVYSSSVTDAEWTILEPLLPAPGSMAAAADDRAHEHATEAQPVHVGCAACPSVRWHGGCSGQPSLESF